MSCTWGVDKQLNVPEGPRLGAAELEVLLNGHPAPGSTAEWPPWGGHSAVLPALHLANQIGAQHLIAHTNEHITYSRQHQAVFVRSMTILYRTSLSLSLSLPPLPPPQPPLLSLPISPSLFLPSISHSLAQAVFMRWMTILYRTLEIPIPAALAGATSYSGEEEERAKAPLWKAKQWTAQVIQRLMRRALVFFSIFFSNIGPRKSHSSS
jgi:hypothetical protein